MNVFKWSDVGDVVYIFIIIYININNIYWTTFLFICDKHCYLFLPHSWTHCGAVFNKKKRIKISLNEKLIKGVNQI